MFYFVLFNNHKHSWRKFYIKIFDAASLAQTPATASLNNVEFPAGISHVILSRFSRSYLLNELSI